MARAATPREIRDVFAHVPTVTLCGLGPDGLIARPMHAALHGDSLIFHGGAHGGKQALIGQPVVVSASIILTRIPSTFIDPRHACPATTLYRSVEVRGILKPSTDPAHAARLLHTYSEALQPEGGFEAIVRSNPVYRASLDKLDLATLPLDQAVGRINLGGHKPPAWRRKVVHGLWNRGGPGDLAAIEAIRTEAPDTPLPEAFAAPVPGVSLHTGTEADLPVVVELLAPQYWNEGVSTEAIATSHRHATAWLVARREGRPIGTLRIVSDIAKHAFLYDVAIAPGAQGQGIGTALIRLALDHPSARHARKVHLRTKDAQGFYGRFGFRENPNRTTLMLRSL